MSIYTNDDYVSLFYSPWRAAILLYFFVDYVVKFQVVYFRVFKSCLPLTNNILGVKKNLLVAIAREFLLWPEIPGT